MALGRTRPRPIPKKTIAFRLVFRTEEKINNGPYMRRIRAALNGIFGGDRKTVDAARAFFGNAGCWYELNEDRFIPGKELEY